MAIVYSQAKTTLDEIAGRIESNRKRVQNAEALLSAAVADLTAMTSFYAGFVTDLDALAAANPTDTAIQTAKSEKDQLVGDFNALKTDAQAKLTAVQGV